MAKKKVIQKRAGKEASRERERGGRKAGKKGKAILKKYLASRSKKKALEEDED